MSDLYMGDCREIRTALPDNSVDTIITDPPYGLEFMGKGWDKGVPGVEFWREFLAVAKPGAMLLAFGGTRTFHRMTCAIEDAGWEIRDCMMWLYGSGFPKSLDISKAIDKAKGAEREKLPRTRVDGKPTGHEGASFNACDVATCTPNAVTDLAREWSGWGTAMKPAWEPIIVAMKPLDGTFAANAEKWGVAGINVDGGRIGTEERTNPAFGVEGWRKLEGRDDVYRAKETKVTGRWPANLLLDEDAAAMLDGQSGVLKSGDLKPYVQANREGYSGSMPKERTVNRNGDSGGASRFFKTTEGDFECCLKEIASIAESRSSHSSQSVVSVVEHAVTWVRPGINLSCLSGLSTLVTPNELKQISANVIALMRIIDGRSLPASFLIGTANSTVSLVSDAEAKRLTATTTTIPNHSISGGSAVLVTFGTMLSNTDRGEAGCRFNYVAKASKSERNAGCEVLPATFTPTMGNGIGGREHDPQNAKAYQNNFHPTVKPLKLMEYLCTLTKTPTGGVVLDPFAGSGTTLLAAKNTGREYIGIEQNPEYFSIIKARLGVA